jgi:hypothetical protein
MSTAAAHTTTSNTRAHKVPQGGQAVGNHRGDSDRAECPPARAAT